jgi:hypothetical protein
MGGGFLAAYEIAGADVAIEERIRRAAELLSASAEHAMRDLAHQGT